MIEYDSGWKRREDEEETSDEGQPGFIYFLYHSLALRRAPR